jgi:hypothetical protein
MDLHALLRLGCPSSVRDQAGCEAQNVSLPPAMMETNAPDNLVGTAAGFKIVLCGRLAIPSMLLPSTLSYAAHVYRMHPSPGDVQAPRGRARNGG